MTLPETSIWTARIRLPGLNTNDTLDSLHTGVFQFEESVSPLTDQSSQQVLDVTDGSSPSQYDHSYQDLPSVPLIDYRDPIQYAVREDGYYCLCRVPLL